MWFGILFALGAVVLISLPAAGVGTFRIGDRAAMPQEWLRVAAPLFFATGCLMASVAYGFRTAKPWSRRVVMVLWAVVAGYGLAAGLLGIVPRAIMWRAVIEAAIFGGICAWYFYVKPNVVAYFRQIQE